MIRGWLENFSLLLLNISAWQFSKIGTPYILFTAIEPGTRLRGLRYAVVGREEREERRGPLFSGDWPVALPSMTLVI